MFRITRGITLQHTPAFSPIFRFSDGTPLPIYAGDDEPLEAVNSSDASAEANAPSESAPNASDSPS